MGEGGWVGGLGWGGVGWVGWVGLDGWGGLGWMSLYSVLCVPTNPFREPSLSTALFYPRMHPPTHPPTYLPHVYRDRHVAFTVASIDPVVARLEAKKVGYTMSKSGRRAVFVRDPDGNALEFMEDVVAVGGGGGGGGEL